MVYSYLMHGKFKPSSFWRANYFPYLLILPPLYSGNFFHFDSQCFYGHIEGRRGCLIPAKCQVNGEGLGSDVLRWVDSFILWMHLWTHISAQSAAGRTSWGRVPALPLECFLALSEQGILKLKGCLMGEGDFLRLHEQKLFGSYDLAFPTRRAPAAVADVLIVLAWSGLSGSSHLMFPPVYLTLQTHSTSCNMRLVN